MKKRVLSFVLALVMMVSMIAPTMVSAETTDRVQQMVDEMSLRDKITQMLMVDFRYWDEDLTDDVAQTGFTVMNDQVRQIVEDYNFGAIIYFAQNLVDTEQAYNLTMAMQEAAAKDGGIPMLISADQEGGSVYRLGTGTALPGNMALGATGNAEYAKMAGEIIGSELSVLGINTDLAPVVDVNNNANNPVIGLRSYGDDAVAVGEMAAASIAGMAEYNVIGCAKHFPGHGDTETDSHYGLPSVDKSLDVLLENELKPYEVSIESGIEMIMTAHILYPQLESDKIVSNKTGEAESLPSTMSDDIITGLLKGDMGFDGIVVTDAMNMAGIADKWDQVQSVVIAIQAGVDMICMPCTLYNLEDLADLDAIIEGVEAAVEDGTIPMERIDDAVTRILTVKENRGILDYNAANYSLETALATVGSDENREKEREIAAAAVTVVKNENNVLPLELTAESKVLMLCPYNNERAQLVMGWNRAVEAGIVPEGAQMDYLRFSNATLSDEIKAKIDWADTIIVVTEVSNASRMAYDHWLSAAPNTFVDYAHEQGKISVIMSADKPYDVQLYPNADAIMAVYGCKGSSVDPTEAIVGGVTGSQAAYGPNIIAGVEVALGTFEAQGKLPVNIPKFDNETDSYTDEIVYERGYGLVYVDMTDLADLLAVIEELNEEDYTEEAWAALGEAIAAAEDVYAHGVQSAEEYEAVLVNLIAAIENTGEEVILPYTDVSETDWYYEYAKDVYEKGLMTGMTETTFGPAENLSRAHFAVILYRMEGEPEVTYSEKFPDVADGQFYTEAVLWAAENGIVTGYTHNGYFGPGDEITREQMATMLYRYAKFKEYDVSATADISGYPDAANVSEFAKEGMSWCVAEEIIIGDNGALDPQGLTVRAVCATIISRFTEI